MNNLLKYLKNNTIARAVILSIPLILVTVMVPYIIGYKITVLTELLRGMICMLVSVALLATKEDKEKIKEWYKENSWELTISAMIGIVMIGFSLFFLSNKDPSIETTVLRIQSGFEFLGILVVIFYSIREIIAGANRIRSIKILFKGFFIYAMIVWLIGNYGDDIYQWINANPEEFNVYLSIFFLLWLSTNFMMGNSLPVYYRQMNGTEAGSAQAFVQPKQLKRDDKMTSAHEIGHLLVHASLGQLPDCFEVVINDENKNSGVSGYVRGIGSTNRDEEKVFSEWKMLMLLGGQVGEKYYLGDNSLGSTHDHARWLKEAKRYLSNHFEGIYYNDPEDQFEQKSNEEKLEKLRKKHQSILADFFQLNYEIYKKFYNELLEKRKLNKKDIMDLISKVKFTDGFPMPFGEFSQFSEKWKAN